jgi:ankyrin repeat protein
MKFVTTFVLMMVFSIPICTQADELSTAVKRGKPDRIRSAIAAGGDINKRYSRNETLLHIAAERDSLPAVQLLVLAGADMNAKDNNGNTPMHVAVTYGRLAVLKFLLTRGADFRIRNGSNQDLDTHAESALTQYRTLPSSGGTDLEKISRYLANTIPKLPSPASSGIISTPSSGAPQMPSWGQADPDDTIIINLSKYSLSPDKIRAAAHKALDKGGWLHLASESNREVGSYFHRNVDKEYRAEILFEGNIAKISYLRDFDSRRSSSLKRVAKNFERELQLLRGTR